MKLIVATAAVVLHLGGHAPAFAQAAAPASQQPQPVDFSGTWVVVASRSVWQGREGPMDITVFGERFTAEQTQGILTIAIDNERGFKWAYRLDGVPSQNLLPVANAQPISSTAAWNGSTLVITTFGMVNTNGALERAETRRTLQFNDDGTLRVEAPWGRNGAMIGSVYSRER